MSVDVLMPKLGESITEGTILEWKKNVGDMVEKDETLLEISTDKVDSEIPSPDSGKVTEILSSVNDVVPVGEVIARIGSNNDEVVEKKSNNLTVEKDMSLDEDVIINKTSKTQDTPSLELASELENKFDKSIVNSKLLLINLIEIYKNFRIIIPEFKNFFKGN